MTPQQFAKKHSNFLKGADTFKDGDKTRFILYAKGTLQASGVIDPVLDSDLYEACLYNPLFETMKQDDRQMMQMLERDVLGIWKNLKHENYYAATEIRKDCTNNREGQLIVLYQNTDGEKFSRELNEFRRKFQKVAALP